MIAYDIFNYRINSGRYPYYKGTPRQNEIKHGDMCVFYIAGKNRGRHTFAAQAKVLTNESPSMYTEDDLHMGSATLGAIAFGEVIKYTNPVEIKKILREINFIKNTDRWGVYFQQGIIKITESDFKTITGQRKT